MPRTPWAKEGRCRYTQGCVGEFCRVIAIMRERRSAAPALKQFVKFCLVGATSFTIDIVLLNTIYFVLGLPLVLAKSASFLAAVTNGFIWNSRWTFGRGDQVAKRFPVFVATNLIGLVLNLAIMTGAIIGASRYGLGTAQRPPKEIAQLILTGAGRRAFDPLTVNTATVVATVVVTAWNFAAAKCITFRK